MLEIIHLLVFQLDIILKGIPLLLRLKIIVRYIQGKEHVPCVGALFPVAFTVGALCYLMVQIGRYFLYTFPPINTSV